MKLYKPWVWRENAIMYDHPSKVVHEPYPFYWYRVTDLEIELVKQISKNCGVVQDWNHYVKPEPVTELIAVSVIEDMYIDHRSWLTLGEVPIDPIDPITTFIWGNKKVQLSFTPDGKLLERKEWVNDQIKHNSWFGYALVKDRYFADRYYSSDGIACNKSPFGWNWTKGKPTIEKKQYEKH